VIGCITIEMAKHTLNCSDHLSKAHKIVSYNLHGLNNGLSFLSDLCSDESVAIIAVQEHWLTNENLHRLSSVHPDFIGLGVSGMTNSLASEIYRGRPFGGLGF